VTSSRSYTRFQKTMMNLSVQLLQGPTLAWYEDCASWLDKSTWQVITCQVIWRGIRGPDASQLVKSICQVELVTASGIYYLRKKFVGVSRQLFFRIAIASEKVFARFFGPFFACCRLSKKRVFGWTRCEIWTWHNPPSTSFARYKQSRSDTGSAQKIGINKEREWKIQSWTSQNVSVKLLIMGSVYVPGIQDICTRRKSAKFQLRLTQQYSLSGIFFRV